MDITFIIISVLNILFSIYIEYKRWLIGRWSIITYYNVIFFIKIKINTRKQMYARKASILA